MADAIGAAGSAAGTSASLWAQYNAARSQGVDSDGDHDGSGSAAAQSIGAGTASSRASGTQGTQQAHRGHRGHHGHRGSQSTQATSQNTASSATNNAPSIASLLTQLDADGDHDGSTSVNSNDAFKATVAQQLNAGTLGNDPLATYNPTGTQDSLTQSGVGNLVNSVA